MADIQSVLELGPNSVGLELTNEQFERARFEVGYDYELVAGRLEVTPAPDLPHDNIAEWLDELFVLHKRDHPEQIAKISQRARVLTRELGGDTNVEPDFTMYREFDREHSQTWWDTSPTLVVEVLSAGTADKDLVRNRDVYLLLPSIEEYWVIDPRADPARPEMAVFVRGDGGWTECRVESGGQYSTDLLPGFVLDLSTVYPD